ncbi:FHA domain-containing protein [Streptomyces sp. NPDC091281]|uniref:FHA domain-containing protein n=1 Tax=Streptomyces sp. NPDC091281 TaxID=3365985 RepID=UPI0037F90DEA
MLSVIVGRTGPFAGQSVVLGDAPLTFGRKSDNDVIIVSVSASRLHAEIVTEGETYVLHDRGSRNGTYVNDVRVTRHELTPGDTIRIGDETFLFETQEAVETVMDLSQMDLPGAGATAEPGMLRVTVSGGGPVGLAFALLLESALPGKVAITVYEGRWRRDGATMVWKDENQGNVRRQQVVTVQSRQYLALTDEMQETLFGPGQYSEMWPVGPDSVDGRPPRNIRIAYIEDRLLALANGKSAIRLVPKRFDAAEDQHLISQEHVFVICEGGRSRSREHFADRFGAADASIYSLDGEHLQDVVLGLRVKSRLPDPMSVLLTVAQNRFLLNSLRGEGFLNMRLTREEAKNVVGIDPVRQVFEECIAARPCVMSRQEEDNEFVCPTHGTLFLPALLRSSPLWKRIREGLKLFGVPEDDLTAITSFRLDMVQRPRFTAQLTRPTAVTPGTYGFLLGDAANAIHFWPGRGLNSGLGSAISLARSLSRVWQGRPLRDADFIRHEAAMSMLQYRHKSRAWNAMVTTDERGVTRAVKDIIDSSMSGTGAPVDADSAEVDLEALLTRMSAIRDRLATRLPGMPTDDALRAHLTGLTPATLRTLQESGAWDTLIVGGEEADIDIFYQQDAPVFVPTDPRVAGGVGVLPAQGAPSGTPGAAGVLDRA